MRKAPYFDGMTMEPAPVRHQGARVMAVLGDSVTTDHISNRPDQAWHPGRAVPRLARCGLGHNSLGSRRGNHEVMIRGTLPTSVCRTSYSTVCPAAGHPRLHAKRAARSRSSTTPARTDKKAGIPLVVLGGKRVRPGSSRDWAARAPSCWASRPSSLSRSSVSTAQPHRYGCGSAAVPRGRVHKSLGLDGTEVIDIVGIEKNSTRASPGDDEGHRHQGGRLGHRVRRQGAHRHPVRPTTTATAASCSTCFAT